MLRPKVRGGARASPPRAGTPWWPDGTHGWPTSPGRAAAATTTNRWKPKHLRSHHRQPTRRTWQPSGPATASGSAACPGPSASNAATYQRCTTLPTSALWLRTATAERYERTILLPGTPICRLTYIGYPPQPPTSPGAKNRAPNRLPGPATPQQGASQYPPSPLVGRPTPPPQQSRIQDVGNCLADLTPDQVPPHQKREGDDWYAIFNPRVQRVLDVELMHNLTHESVVCCVRFSHDGRFVATGCNRSAQIFDVHTGRQVVSLQDDAVDKEGDLYIRSVCFSPDGKYLATGAEDKLIRVCQFDTSLSI